MTTVLPCAKNRTALGVDGPGGLQDAPLERRRRAVHLVRDEAGDPAATVKFVAHEIGERAPHVRRDPHSIQVTDPRGRV